MTLVYSCLFQLIISSILLNDRLSMVKREGDLSHIVKRETFKRSSSDKDVGCRLFAGRLRCCFFEVHR